MKTTILAAVSALALFAAVPAFGQSNTSDVIQSGTDGNASVTQSTPSMGGANN